MTVPPRWARRDDRVAYGKTLRDRCKRADQGRWELAPDRDVMARLRTAEHGRQQDLLKFKYGKMAGTPFAFLRGSAPVMAKDLAAQPSTGYTVQICGDAHVRNLGAYATADGRTVFDMNDFDETCRAPWEWDVKRLAASIVLVGREARCGERACRDAAVAMVTAWRETMFELSEISAVELARVRVKRFAVDGAVGRTLTKARRMTPLIARDRLTQRDAEGVARFVNNRVPDAEAQQVLDSLLLYREHLPPARQQVFDAYRAYDVARKIAGTGSLGCHNYAVILEGNGGHDPLILQVKQAMTSCYRGQGLVEETVEHEGKRIVEGAAKLQTEMDPFLGWTTIAGEPYIVRQIADHTASIDLDELGRAALVEYARVCGETFAKGHARTSDPAILAGYAGIGDNLDQAIGDMAVLAADQTTRDRELLLAAIAKGEVQAEPEEKKK